MDSNIKMKVMKNASVIQKENGFGRLLKFDCSDGLGLMTVYNVFPGIELIYNEFETTEFSWKNNTSGNVMEIIIAVRVGKDLNLKMELICI